MSEERKQSNAGLRGFYEEAYRSGESEVFTFFEDGKHVSEDHSSVVGVLDWTGKRVLDVGCGTGQLCRDLSALGASETLGIDYSQEGIAEAQRLTTSPFVSYLVEDVMNLDVTVVGKFDVITVLGTLEHMDSPSKVLDRLRSLLSVNGMILVTCPHFLNVRGYVWMALSKLLKVPMSLSDLHFIHPWNMEEWGSIAGLRPTLLSTFDRQFAQGQRLIKDFNKRLRNALTDAELPTNGVDDYLRYLEKLVAELGAHSDRTGMDGATALWKLEIKVDE